jgi:hypothetical protein
MQAIIKGAYIVIHKSLTVNISNIITLEFYTLPHTWTLQGPNILKRAYSKK